MPWLIDVHKMNKLYINESMEWNWWLAAWHGIIFQPNTFIRDYNVTSRTGITSLVDLETCVQLNYFYPSPVYYYFRQSRSCSFDRKCNRIALVGLGWRDTTWNRRYSSRWKCDWLVWTKWKKRFRQYGDRLVRDTLLGGNVLGILTGLYLLYLQC